MTDVGIAALGAAAAICSMSSFAPQALKIMREHDASSISLRMYLVTVAGFALWVAYGVRLQSWPLVASNTVCLALSTLILALKIRFGATADRSNEGGSDTST